MQKTVQSMISYCLVVAILAFGNTTNAAPQKTPPTTEVVNINDATSTQLELLPGIGPSKAEAIITYRNKKKFRAVYEIMRVRGIGRKIFQKIQPLLTITGPTTLTNKSNSDK